MDRGLVHLYTGGGKGKTTAALGLALRALGAGYEVYFHQFMKRGDSSEFKVLRSLDKVHTAFFGKGKFIHKEKKDEAYLREAESNRKGVRQILELFEDIQKKGNEEPPTTPKKRYLVVLDEICLLLFFDIVTVGEVRELIDAKPDNVELVFTGRKAPQELIENCDYVSEIKEIKHPYKEGIPAREGIES